MEHIIDEMYQETPLSSDDIKAHRLYLHYLRQLNKRKYSLNSGVTILIENMDDKVLLRIYNYLILKKKYVWLKDEWVVVLEQEIKSRVNRRSKKVF
jgi:hypothetical protein